MSFFGNIFGTDKKQASEERFDRAVSRYKSLLKSSSDTINKLYKTRKEALRTIKKVETQLLSNPNVDDNLLRAIADAHNNIREFEDSVIQEQSFESGDRKNSTGATAAAAGVATATAISTLGPTAAMAVATTFGTAATGTAISTLSGVAATNAALAWLGGGAIAAGGGGMAAGSAVLALAGPIGVIVGAGIAVGGGATARKKNLKAAAENEARTKDIHEKCEKIQECCREINKTQQEVVHDTEVLNSLLSNESANYYEILSVILRMVNGINKRFTV